MKAEKIEAVIMTAAAAVALAAVVLFGGASEVLTVAGVAASVGAGALAAFFWFV